MTTNPPPWAAPVSLVVGPLKLWMWLRKGRYMSPTRIWPPTPMTIPTASIGRKRRPRSKTNCRVPRTRLANHGPAKKPTHSPTRLAPTYHSGGAESLAMALSWLPSPARSAAMAAKTKPTISPAKKPRSPKNSQNQPSPRVSGGAPATSRKGRSPQPCALVVPGSPRAGRSGTSPEVAEGALWRRRRVGEPRSLDALSPGWAICATLVGHPTCDGGGSGGRYRGGGVGA